MNRTYKATKAKMDAISTELSALHARFGAAEKELETMDLEYVASREYENRKFELECDIANIPARIAELDSKWNELLAKL